MQEYNTYIDDMPEAEVEAEVAPSKNFYDPSWQYDLDPTNVAAKTGAYDRLAMEALGGTQALGDIAAGAMTWLPTKITSAAIGPFFKGGPKRVEKFLSEGFAPPTEGPEAAGYETIMGPVGRAMDVVTAPAKFLEEKAEPYVGENLAYLVGFLTELATFKGIHVAGKGTNAAITKVKAKLRRAEKKVAEAKTPKQKAKAKEEADKALVDSGELLNKFVSENPEAKKAVDTLDAEKKIPDIVETARQRVVSGQQGKRAEGVDPQARKKLMDDTIKVVPREAPKVVGEQIQGGTPFERVPERVVEPGVAERAAEEVRLREFERTGRSGGQVLESTSPAKPGDVVQGPQKLPDQMDVVPETSAPQPQLPRSNFEQRAQAEGLSTEALAWKEALRDYPDFEEVLKEMPDKIKQELREDLSKRLELERAQREDVKPPTPEEIEARAVQYLDNLNERVREAVQGDNLDVIRSRVDDLYSEVSNLVDVSREVGRFEDASVAMEKVSALREEIVRRQRSAEIVKEAKESQTSKIQQIKNRKSLATPDKLARLKAAAARLNNRLGERGSMPVESLPAEVREALERFIKEARRTGRKFEEVLRKYGVDERVLGAMQQVAKQYDRDVELAKQAPQATGQVVNKTKGRAYVDKNTGERAFRQYPPVFDFQQQMVKDVADMGPTSQALLEVSGRFLDRLGNLGHVLRDAFRDNDGNMAREVTKTKKDIRDVRKGLGWEGKQELIREFYQNQEGGDAALKQLGLERSEVPIETRSPKAAIAYEKLRELYDELGRRVNEVRKRSGKQPFKWEERYGPFILDMEKMGKNPLGGSVEDIYAMYNDYIGNVKFGYEKSRKRGRNIDRVFKETDPFTIMDGYMRQALKYIHHGEQVAWVKELLDTPWKEPVIKDGVHQKDVKGNPKYRKVNLKIKNQRLYQSLANWNNAVAGARPKTSLSPKAQSVMRTLSNSVVFSTMSYNIGSYLNQTAALIQANMVLGERYLVAGVYDLIRSAMPGSGLFEFMMKNSNEMARRFGAFDPSISQAVYGSKFKTLGKVRGAIGKAGMMPVAVTDFAAASVTWYGAYRQGLKLLKNSKRAAMYADDVVIRTQGSGAAGEVSPIQRTPEGKFVTTLQTFAINNWNFLVKDMLGYKNPKIRTKDRMMRLQRFIMGSAILGYVFEDILNVNSPMPNMVRAAIDLVENGESPKEVAKGIINFVMEGAEVVPLAGSVVKYRGSLFGAVTDALEKGLEIRSPKAVAEALMRLSGVPGTSQLKKSLRQIEQDASIYDIIMGGKYTPVKKASSGRGTRRARPRRATRSR